MNTQIHQPSHSNLEKFKKKKRKIQHGQYNDLWSSQKTVYFSQTSPSELLETKREIIKGECSALNDCLKQKLLEGCVRPRIRAGFLESSVWCPPQKKTQKNPTKNQTQQQQWTKAGNDDKTDVHNRYKVFQAVQFQSPPPSHQPSKRTTSPQWLLIAFLDLHFYKAWQCHF